MFKLTEKQQEIIDSSARVKLVMGGQRSGKTTLAIISIWERMKKSTSCARALFLVPSERCIRHTVGKIKDVILENYISSERCQESTTGRFFILINTKLGQIFVSDHFILDSFDIVAFDNATSNNHITPEILKRRENLYFTGHCPDDIRNAFFLMWLKAYFSGNKDVKAFSINTPDNPEIKDNLIISEEQLRNRMSVSRYNRDFLCIPDYLDHINPEPNDWLRQEHISRAPAEFQRQYMADFSKCIENDEIEFSPPTKYGGYFTIGFDKAKE